MEHDDLQRRFSYHPSGAEQPGYYGAIRASCLQLALNLDNLCPEGREKGIAMRKLEEVMFWANASIARNGDALPKV